MSYKVHNVRWVGLEGRAGTCMAYSRSRKLLALSRADNSIEIWNFASRNSVPVLERCIPAQATKGSVEALAFAGPRAAREDDESGGSDSDTDNEATTVNRRKKKVKGSNTPWIDEDLRFLRKKRRAAERAWRKDKHNREKRILYTVLCKQFEKEELEKRCIRP